MFIRAFWIVFLFTPIMKISLQLCCVVVISILSAGIAQAQTPTVTPTTFEVSAFGENTLTVAWTATADPNRTHYLIMANTTGVFVDPVNASTPTNDAALGDGSAVLMVAGTDGDQSFATLNAGTVYHFKIYPVNNNGDAGDPLYYIGGALTTSRTTLAGVPAGQPSGITFSNIANTSMTVNWAAAGTPPDNYMVVRGTVDPTFAPADGQSYTVGNTYGDGTIIYFGTALTTPSTSLSANTTYHYEIYSVNGTGAAANYLTGTAPPVASQITLFNEPTTQATNIVFSNFAETTLTLTWTNGDGTERLVVGKAAGAVDFAPVDGMGYVGDANFGAADIAGAPAGNKALYRGNSNTVNITGLTAGTVYHFQIFERLGTNTQSNYLVTTATGNPASVSTTATQPATQATAITFSNLTNTSVQLNWTNGTGNTRIVVARQGSNPVDPTDRTTYTANAAFGSGSTTAAGSFVVYKGTSNTVTVTGLTSATQYNFQVYDFNSNSDGDENYKPEDGAANNPRNITTTNEPANHVTALAATANSTPTINVSWTGATGSPAPQTYLVLGRNVTDGGVHKTYGDGVAVPGNDDNLSNADNGSRQVTFGTNNYNGWTNIEAGKEYEFMVVPYRTGGTVDPDFKTDAPIPTVTVFSEPSASSTPTLSNLTSSSIDVTVVAGGSATGFLVVRRQGAAPTTPPTDGTAYVAGNTLAAGETVVYSGGTGTFTDGSLSPLTTYHYAVWAYSGTGTLTNYRTAGHGTANATTLCASPATQATNITFGTTLAGSTVVNWTRGSGDNVLVLMRAVDGNPNNVTPNSGTTYTANSNFGDGTSISITGNDYYTVYNGPLATVTVNDLSSATQYNVRVFEYNNTNVCYNLVAAPSANITTASSASTATLTGGQGYATVPTTAQAVGTRADVFTFTITDVGGDGSALDISQMIFTQLPNPENQIVDWRELIAGAQLRTPGATQNAHTVAINATNITISAIARDVDGGNTELGEINDNASKTYTLAIWLRPDLSLGDDQPNLPSIVDGLRLGFQITSAQITTDSDGSGILPAQSVDSNDNGSNGQISVVATAIRVTQQPSTPATQSVALTTRPIFEAIDAFNNRDLGFGNAITVNTTNPTNLGPANALANFTSGIADFHANATSFNFTNTGTSTMSVTANSITSTNTNSITVNPSTAVAIVTGGVSGTTLNSADTDLALLGFSLQTTGATLNFQGLQVTTSSTAVNKITNIRLYHSTTNNFATGVLTELATASVTASPLVFTAFTQSINGSASYYFIAADIEPSVSSSTPSFQITLTPSTGVTVSSGAAVGSAVQSAAYTFADVTPPTISSITNTVNPIFEGALTQTVTVVFSEPMNPAFQPTITLSGTNWGAQTPVGANGWSNSTTYVATFLHNGTEETIAAATSSITSPSGAQDVSGNGDTGNATSSNFRIDTQKPVATVTANATSITAANLSKVVTVRFTESMNTSFPPTITFGTSTHFTPANPGAWSTVIFTNDTWTRTFTHDGTEETILSEIAQTANASGAVDLSGNTDVGDASGNFTVDTQLPRIVSITSPSLNMTYTTGGVLNIDVNFDEDVNRTGFPTLSLSSGGTAVFVTDLGSTLRFQYTVLAGENATDLNVTAVNLSGGTIRDVRNNNAVLTLPPANQDLAFHEDINIDTQAPSVVSVSALNADGAYNAGDVINITVQFNEPVWVTGVPQLTLNVSSPNAVSYSSGSGTNTLQFDYTVVSGHNVTDLDYANFVSLTLAGTDAIQDVVFQNANLTLANPGAANSLGANKDLRIDTTLPFVSSVAISSPTNSWSTTNGISGAFIDYLITFNEAVTGVDETDFDDFFTGSLTYSSISITGSGNTRTLRVNDPVGPGRLRFNVLANGSIVDIAGNTPAAVFNTFFSGDDYYSVTRPEPSAPVTGFNVSTSSPTSLTVEWTNPVTPTVAPNFYYIQLKRSSVPSFAVVAKGFYYTPFDTDFSDGTLATYVAHAGTPTQTHTFTGLSSGVSYNVKIYPVSWNQGVITNDNTDYRISDAVTASGSTTTGNAGTLTYFGENTTISSLINLPAGRAVIGFDIRDDGVSSTIDDTPFKFSDLILTPGAQNDITDWSEAIEGARLEDGSGVEIDATTISANTIEFTGIPSASASDLGFVSDDGVKSYILWIWLKPNLGGNLPATIDNMHFDFAVTNASFTYDNASNSQVSSTLAPSQLIQSTSTGMRVVVTAQKFAFQTPGTPGTPTHPQAQIGVGSNFPAPNEPKIYALDNNNNLDEDFNQAITVSNTSLFPQSNGHTTFPLGGVLTVNNYSILSPGFTAINIQSAGMVQASSTLFEAVITDLSQITASTALTEPDEISSLSTTAPIDVFDFTITDDVGANAVNFNDNDALPTRISSLTIVQGDDNAPTLANWTHAIAHAELSDGTNTMTGTVTATSIVFAGMANLDDELGHIDDGQSKTYTLRIYLKDPILSIADVIDNKHFEFAISDANVVTLASPESSTFQPGGAESGATKNKVDVDATRLDFTTLPNATQSYDANIAPSPVVKARDENGNVDLDYAGTPTVATVTPATYTLANTGLTNTAGIITFNSNFQVTSAGNGPALGTTQLIVSDGALTNAVSNTITLNYSSTSDIVRNTSFTYPTNISYIQHQATTITDANSVVMEEFTVRDGGAAANDPDGTPTVLNALTLNVGNYQYVRKIAIFDGSTPLAEADANDFITSGVNQGNVSFSSFELSATDNMSKTLSVKVSFKATGIPDHALLTFKVVSVAARLTSSSQFGTTSPSGIETVLTPGSDENKLQVIATQVDFIVPSSATEASLNSNFAVTVHARDINANLDLDFSGAGSEVREVTNQTSATMINTPTIGSTTFTNGVLTFPTNFQFTSGVDEQIVTLSIKAGANTTCGGATICGTSPQIKLSSSFESELIVNPAFTPTANIRYIQYQAADITSGSTSIPLAEFLLRDGDGTPDDDGAATNIEDLTFSLTNHANVRKLALYIGSVEIQEKPAAASVTFDNLSSLISAPDNGSVVITVRASFNNTVTDNHVVQLHVTGATQSGGSQFNNVRPTPIGGITNGAFSDPNVRVEVVATQLVFVTPPPAFGGISPMTFTVPVVEAQDANGMVDLDMDEDVDADAVGEITTVGLGVGAGESPFQNGSMTFAGFSYSQEGDGTLNVKSYNEDNLDIYGTSSAVDVIHITTALATSGVYNGSLGGGVNNRVIFGVTFRAPYRKALEPSLDRFTISFSTTGTITGVFNNIRVYQSEDNIFDPVIDAEVTTLGATITPASRAITVDFASGTGGELGATGDPGSPNDAVELTYFLQVDVDPSANAGTAPVRPILVDDGASTAGNILATVGSQFSDIQGNNYDFAAINAPTIVSSYPASGQINVDPTQPTIELVYTVPVWTLDGKIGLYDHATDALVAELTAQNGIYAGITSPLAGTQTTPLTFTLPTLQSDHMYYIKIAPGKYVADGDPANVGIMDQSKIVSPGFSYPGTLYFKTAKAAPPKMLTTPAAPKAPSITNISTTGATINAIFDQPGKAHFMVVPIGSPVPNAAQVRDELPYIGDVAIGSFDINQTNTIYQFGLINATLVAGATYDVYVCAQSYSSKNKFLTPIPTAAPYGSAANGFLEGSAGPTMRFTVPAATALIKVFKPTLQNCANSWQIMNSPIVIVEGTTSDFTTVGTDPQNFNLLLPSGFQFDITTVPGATPSDPPVPVYGKAEVFGGDFGTNKATLSFVNNSIVRVTFKNTNNSTIDNIAISGLRILGNTSSSGKMIRLGGQAIPGLSDNTEFAILSANDAQTIDFTNSYNEFYYEDRRPAISFIPDNFNAPALTTQLIPLPKDGDFGPSSFAGTGVNVNQLNLTAVPLGTPFNITITHTDNNGCTSVNPVQYTVYDHTQAIGGLNTGYCADNENYPADPTFGSQVFTIVHDALQSRIMRTLTADIPAGLEGRQTISGPEWKAIIQNLPVVSNTIPDPNDVTGTKFFRDYQFDLANILNAMQETNGAIADPYAEFRERTQVQGNVYYTGGSLGEIEFTADYQSSTNQQLEFPMKQNVKVYLPAIPIVEVDLTNRVSLDTVDVLNPVPNPKPNKELISYNKGTPVFCVAGGEIKIFGYPQGANGRFKVVDATNPSTVYADYTISPAIEHAGFRLTGNGTAAINPNDLQNGFRDIKITYVYSDENTPCGNDGSQIIRIAPNPVANFTFESEPGENIADATSYCADRRIDFDAGSSTSGGGTTIAHYKWNFNDAANSSGTNPNQPEGDADEARVVFHSFKAATYDATLTVTSNVGCQSSLRTLPVEVGAIPVVAFSFTGVSTHTPIQFVNQSSINDNPATANDVLNWDFGDTQSGPDANPSAPMPHTYAAAGIYTAELEVVSELGCVNRLSKTVGVVPYVALSNNSPAYQEDFQTSNGGYQVLATPDFNGATSWEHGRPNGSVITGDAPVRVWTTGLASSFAAAEHSSLYTPAFNLTALGRPIITFNSFTHLGAGDGVVIEYSTDNLNIADPAKDWKTLGTGGIAPSGVNWYNDGGNSISTKPGKQETGFGRTGKQSEWLPSKHSLAAIPQAERGNVAFRFTFASFNTNPTGDNLDGFAIDDVRVGSATRTVLIENFTNTASTDANVPQVNDYIRTFRPAGEVGSELVKINYHVAFPGVDPFNQDNQADPGARALYYNVSTIPQTRMDGKFESTPSTNFFDWGGNALDRQVLNLANAHIELKAEIQNDKLVVSGYFIPYINITESTLLHLALVEEQVPLSSIPNNGRIKTNETEFDYVLKRMLPSAAGIKFPNGDFPTGVPAGDTVAFGPFDVYDITTFEPANDLAVIAFLQDENSADPLRNKTVYQSDLVRGFLDPGIVTGTDEDLDAAFKVYPNPADKEMIVELPVTMSESSTLQMFDQMGKVVDHSVFDKGQKSRTIDTSEMAGGVYLIQINTPKGVLRRKVMVLHNH